jgi:superfamily II DNA helicase RecQ
VGLLAGDLPDGTAESLRDVMDGSGIIYTATTRAAQETAAWLREWGISAAYYHGRLKSPSASACRLHSWTATCA